jgi:hypothetical protein
MDEYYYSQSASILDLSIFTLVVHSGLRFHSGCFPFAGFLRIPPYYEFIPAFFPEPCRNAKPAFLPKSTGTRSSYVDQYENDSGVDQYQKRFRFCSQSPFRQVKNSDSVPAEGFCRNPPEYCQNAQPRSLL